MLISYVETMEYNSKRCTDKKGEGILRELRQRDGTRVEIRKGM